MNAINKLILPTTVAAALGGLLAIAPSSALADTFVNYTFDTSTPNVSGTLVLDVTTSTAESGSTFSAPTLFGQATWDISAAGSGSSVFDGSFGPAVLVGGDQNGSPDPLDLIPTGGNPAQLFTDDLSSFSGVGSWVPAQVTPVPETAANPVMVALAGIGVAGIGMVRRIKTRSAAN